MPCLTVKKKLVIPTYFAEPDYHLFFSVSSPRPDLLHKGQILMSLLY